MFDSVQMAVSRVIKLQHHRIAQVGVPDHSSLYFLGHGAWKEAASEDYCADTLP